MDDGTSVAAPPRGERWITTPVFGRCKLVPHEMSEEPANILAYVERAHTGSTLTLAMFDRGTWKTHSRKPMSSTVTAWYSLEREDGRPIF